jgi:hypothetical protein
MQSSDNVDPYLIKARFVFEESEVQSFEKGVKVGGGQVESVRSYTPRPEELDDYADGQFEPLMVVAVAVSLGYLIRTISNVWLDHTHPGGTIVDTRDGCFETKFAPHIERGKLVVISDDGVQEFESSQKDEGASLLRALADSNA